MQMKTIAVFGSAISKPGDADYEAAREVGRLLAERDFTTMSGGYEGVMEAVSKGANEAGGHVIGVTCEQIENYRGFRANAWVTQEIKYPTLRERVDHLMNRADGYVVMPGGLGTLHEMVMVWESMRVGELSTRPLVCYGEYWQKVIEPLRDSAYISIHSWTYIDFADTSQETVEIIQQRLAML
jgi:uncharacterized protein (TIGR00730 family)